MAIKPKAAKKQPAGMTLHGFTIVNGSITREGSDEEIGRLDQDYKHGYHPIVRLTVKSLNLRKEYEMDHPGGIVNGAFADLRTADTGKK